jgi:formylglycine-generating enzyme required for sulfatase activity
VTRTQYRAFIKEAAETSAERGGHVFSGVDWVFDPSCTWETPGFHQADDHPVTVISHGDAVDCCRWMARHTGVPIRLPTEAEWEYFARAGGKCPSTYSFGETLNGAEANCDGNHPYGTPRKGDYLRGTTPVGKYAAKGKHPWGVADVHGNVWEWCADWYQPSFYSLSPAADPLCTGGEQKHRVQRGGSWHSAARRCRSAYRNHNPPDLRTGYYGFRVVFNPD